MKKYWSTRKYKNWNERHSNYEINRRSNFKKYKKQKNKRELNLPRPERVRNRKIKSQYWDYEKIEAPSILSLVNNTEDVINFISRIKTCYDNNQKVYIILKKVTQLTHDAIVVLLAIMVRFDASNIEFNGDFPDDNRCKNILINSGFFFKLSRVYRDVERYDIDQIDSIHTHAYKNVDSALSAKIIQRASQTIWGEERRCQGAQRVLLELMQNTNNHASIGKTGDKHWWLSVNHNRESKKVGFSFVDFGVGVFRSLDNKRPGNKFYQWFEKLNQRVKFGNDSELLKLILEGHLHSIVANEEYRGKGLPGINQALKRGQISNLRIITNKVRSDVDNNDFTLINVNLEGTFIFFELNETSFNCHGQINI